RAFLDELAKARKAIATPTGETPAVGKGSVAAGRLVAAGGVVLLALAVPIAFMALRNPPDTPAEATKADSKTTETGKNEDDSPKKPKVVRIDEESRENGSKPQGTNTNPSSGTGSGDSVAKEAQLLLDRANQFHADNPDDSQGYAARLRAVVDKY